MLQSGFMGRPWPISDPDAKYFRQNDSGREILNKTGRTTKTGTGLTGLMKNDVPWRSAQTADSHSTWKSLAKPRSALPHFSQARRGPSPSTQNGRERERPVPKTFRNAFDDFRFVLCPSPEPESNWPGATTVNRTARGYESVSSAASSNRVGNLRGLRSAAGRASIRVWCRLVCNSNEKPKAAARYRWRCFLFADWRGVRFFSAGEIFVS